RYRFIENNQPHFLTCTTVNWLPLLTDEPIVRIILQSLQFLLDRGRLELYAYVIMKSHLHMIASSKSLSNEVRKFKSFTAREIIDYFNESGSIETLEKLRRYKLRHKGDRTHQLWQEGSHPELIQSPEMMREKIDYIHYNPVRESDIEDPLEWPYSSARDYAGNRGFLKITTTW
ncbi:MAG: transposase, partial [Bacteroidota bacterium]